MPKKEDSPQNNNVLISSGLSGKSITGLVAWRTGSVAVIEVNYTGGPTYIKVKGFQTEIGGDANWGTGTLAVS